MFPCSSIYQHFPLTNQTWTINDHDHNSNNNNTFQIDHDQNPIMIISASNHQQQQQHSSPHSHNVNIPSIFEDDGVMLSHLLSQQQFLSCCNNNIDTTTSCSRALGDEIGVVDPSRNGDNRKAAKNRRAKQSAAVVPPPRKRTAGKKDRHSKICTAQGLRDRRMRLSLQIARKFFDLQDMLGFDKASRTIDWLFTKSKTAIRELKDSLVPHKHHHHNLSSSNSTSDQCEAASKAMAKIGDECDDDDDDDDGQFISVPNKDMKKMRKVVARESRDKARARARERTRERMLERWRRNGSADTTISEAENHSANALELKGEEEVIMTCHSDSKPVVSRPDQAEPTDRFLPDYSPISQDGRVGVSTICGANSEEDFLGLPDQNWDIFNCSSKTQPFCPKDMGNNVVRVQNPYAILTANSGGHFCSSIEQKPSFIKVPTSSKARNPSSAFVANTARGGGDDDDGEQNPNPMFIMDDDDQQFDHHEQNLASSDFLAGSNVFCSLNF